jgi:hypothetical protein
MLDQEFTCVDCGKAAPPTDEGETITRQHGWRITRVATGSTVTLQPRCPACYARHRASLPPTPAKGSK